MIVEASVETEQNSSIQNSNIDETPSNPGNRAQKFWDVELIESPNQIIESKPQLVPQLNIEDTNQKVSSRPKTALSNRKDKQLQRAVSASHKRPSTAREVTFDENIAVAASSQRKISKYSREVPSSASTIRLSEFQADGYPNSNEKSGIRPISAALSMIYHTNDRSITFEQSHNADAKPENFRQMFESYQSSMQKSKLFNIKHWAFNDKYAYVKRDKKPNFAALQSLTFEVQQKKQPLFSLANPEFFQHKHLSQAALQFDSSKIVLPDNHTFLDVIAVMEKNTQGDKETNSHLLDSRLTHGTSQARVKTKENLEFVERSYRNSIVQAPELRKEPEKFTVKYMMPRSNSMELPRNLGHKSAHRSLPKKQASGIGDIIVFEHMKDQRKLHYLAALIFLLSKRNKSKHLPIFNDLVKEQTTKHDWSKYQKALEGNHLNGLIIDVTTFDHLLAYDLKIESQRLTVPTKEGPVSFDDLVKKFQDTRRAKVVLAIVYSLENNVKHIIFSRFLVSPCESSFEEDMKAIYRFYLTVLAASRAGKKPAKSMRHEEIFYLVDKVMEDENNEDALRIIWQDILRLNEETIWVDFQAGVEKLAFNRFLKRRYPNAVELDHTKPIKKNKNQGNGSGDLNKLYLSPIINSNSILPSLPYPQAFSQELQSFSQNQYTDVSSMPNLNDLVRTNTKIRAQSAIRRDKSQSYEKQVADIREKTLFAIRSSSKEFRSLQAEAESQRASSSTLRFEVKERDTGQNLFVYDKTKIAAKHKQPLLVKKVLQSYNRRYSEGIK